MVSLLRNTEPSVDLEVSTESAASFAVTSSVGTYISKVMIQELLNVKLRLSKCVLLAL